ncbi:hypothetical protein EI555_016175 [Monodon monoceros]|uniref:AAA+ ATPase domain-containing protein n=1 Tax=Monodon monoceros TaxID=40151 RepID=A0A4U1ENR4_MONMO|nr:hypothetical protein EI555_016175 [Monodon monoceros]
MSSLSPIQIPSRLPLLLTHEGVLLPGSTMRTSVDSARNLQLVRSRLLKGTSLQSTILGVIPNTPDPASDAQDLPPLHSMLSTNAVIFKPPKPLSITLLELVEMLDMSVPAVAKLRRLLDSLPREALPDILTSIIRTSNKEKLQVIAIRPIRRITHIPGTLEDEDEDEDNDDIVMLEKKIRTSSMPDQAHKVCVKEIKRLKKMPQSMPEYALTRNYLELMVELPWNKSTTDRLDIRAARILLDNDHYAMEKLKKRVLEYLAVRQLKNNLKGPILCFVGPPGVGKTSVGRSVAKTLGREFHRIALGGVCDQSDIRGHRRTYVGSMPGRIINGLKTVGVNNPVFLLDEVDKLGKSLQGDPAAALLEVLDPEQNHNFTDHYLNVAFDLSQVLFIATANTTATIPPALLDRMEIIQVPGYTQEEKIEIAHRHLIPKQLEQHGLTPQQIQIPQVTTLDIITRYTREAGVRSLDRKLGAICRAVAVKVAEGQHREARLDRPDVAEGEGYREHIVEDTKPESISDTTDLALPPEMPILIDFHALKDILGPPIPAVPHAPVRTAAMLHSAWPTTSQLYQGKALLGRACKRLALSGAGAAPDRGRVAQLPEVTVADPGTPPKQTSSQLEKSNIPTETLKKLADGEPPW